MQTYTTNSFEETQKLGENLAKKILEPGVQKSAVVLGLQGNLGGGKTTFLQGFAKGLGIDEKILSPTYVIQKRFSLPSLRGHNNARSNPKAQIASSPEAPRNDDNFTNFYHIDCYRINKPEEILELGWKEIILDPKNIVVVEWPEKIKKFLPKQTMFLDFKFVNETQREISF